MKRKNTNIRKKTNRKENKTKIKKMREKGRGIKEKHEKNENLKVELRRKNIKKIIEVQ